MDYYFLFVILFLAILDWIAVAKNWRRLEYFAKPAVMVVLIRWLWLVSEFQGLLIWFAIGLFFSLIGDILLMLPKEQFLAGLVAFLLGQLAYLVGFTRDGLPTINLPFIIIVVIVIGTAFQICRRIAISLKSTGNAKFLVPVFIYSGAISLMLLSAVTTLLNSEWQPMHALAVSCGAMLFFISDTLLAWNKFVTPIPNGRLLNIIPYHLGQILITIGATIHQLSIS